MSTVEATAAPKLAAFDTSLQPPSTGSTDFVRFEWAEVRSSGIVPLNVSSVAGTAEDRAEFLAGAELLRLVGERRMPGARLHPQQLLVHDVLAAGRGVNSILLPRRSAKSTSLIAEGLGRAQAREDYRVGILTATTGKAGRSRFKKDVVPHLTRLHPDKRTAPYVITLAAGQEAVQFRGSGGFVQWLSTVEDARGEAFDMLIVDEAQDPEPTEGADVLAAVMPTLDTRPDAQLVFAGTAGLYRRGNLLWDALDRGRRGSAGILEYAAPPHTTDDELAAWDPTDEHPAGHVRELVLAAHPGIDTLTTLQRVRENFEALPREVFAREYLSLFGDAGGGSGVVNMERWADGAIAGDLPQPPDRFALAMSVHPDQRSAAIVAVWRVEGFAHLLVLDHRRGVSWVADEALRLSRRYSTPIVHDVQGAVSVEVEFLQRQTPRPRLAPQTFPNIKTAAALLIKEIDDGRVRHYDQDPLSEAARLARKRSVGPTAWALGRGDAEDDIVCLEAAAMALRAFDDTPNRPKLLNVVSQT